MLESVMPTSWTMIGPGTGTSTTLRIEPSGAHDDVLHVVPLPVVADDVELAGDRIALGMGGERARPRPVEVEVADRLELVVELDR